MIINLISSPRNISTAMMYSFAQRPDTKAMDEPFYGYYLSLTGADHPGKEEIIADQPGTVDGVTDWINQVAAENEVVFVKNMAHHLIQMDTGFLKNYQNVFLIRNPKQLIASFSQVIPSPCMADVGIQRQNELWKEYREAQKCPIIDSNEVVKNPEKVLTEVCRQLDLDFTPKMLQWTPGPLSEDGVWAKYWYKNVHATSGFSKQATSERDLPENCVELYQESKPYYDELFEHSIKA